MSKVTPSALRGLSVAAGTVSLAAVGAALAAPAGAATAGLPGLGSGLPLSTNALSAVKGLTAHNGGQIAGVPIAGLPVLNQLPQAMESAAPGLHQVPGLGGVDLGAAKGPQAQTRSRVAEPGRESPAHAAAHPGSVTPPAGPAAFPAPANPMPNAPAPAPAGTGAPSAAAAQTAQIAAQNPQNAAPAAAAAPKAASPLENLPVVGGLAGNLPLLGGASPLGGLPIGGLAGGLSHF